MIWVPSCVSQFCCFCCCCVYQKIDCSRSSDNTPLFPTIVLTPGATIHIVNHSIGKMRPRWRSSEVSDAPWWGRGACGPLLTLCLTSGTLLGPWTLRRSLTGAGGSSSQSERARDLDSALVCRLSSTNEGTAQAAQGWNWARRFLGGLGVSDEEQAAAQTALHRLFTVLHSRLTGLEPRSSR